MKPETDTPIEILITFPLAEELQKKLTAVSPRIHITVVPAHQASEINAETWKRTEILITERVIPKIDSVPNLKWIQFTLAGIDFVLDEPGLMKSDITLTTLSGAAAPQVAEHAVSMMLALSHNVPVLLRHQRNHEWPPDRFARLTPLEIRNSVVGLIGYGSIGREIARLLQPFEVSILACKHNVMEPEDDGYIFEGLGDPEGDLFTRLYPFQAIKSMVKLCDFVVISLPKTPETTGIYGEAEFSAMKPSAYLVDVSRGGIVKASALRDALQEKKIAGAALDVFEQEPLPKESPMWDTSHLIISPHIAGISTHYNKRAVEMITENLNRYMNNVPLLNTFSRELGY